jgi:disulfide bond formation protein DsbB
MSPDLSRALNITGLFAVSAVLLVAFWSQLVGGELPCPLCLLQRAGFVCAAMGLALNVRFGPRPSHYAIVVLSSVAGAAVAARQVMLHIVPGSGAYGEALFGLHFYSWAFVVFTAMVAGSALMLLFDRQFEPPRPAGRPALGTAAIALAALLAVSNGVSTVIECGGGLCPDNPTDYLLLEPAAPAGGG